MNSLKEFRQVLKYFSKTFCEDLTTKKLVNSNSERGTRHRHLVRFVYELFLLFNSVIAQLL